MYPFRENSSCWRSTLDFHMVEFYRILKCLWLSCSIKIQNMPDDDDPLSKVEIGHGELFELTLTILPMKSLCLSLFVWILKNDQRHNRPAWIQIEFVNHEHEMIILVELFLFIYYNLIHFIFIVSLLLYSNWFWS